MRYLFPNGAHVIAWMCVIKYALYDVCVFGGVLLYALLSEPPGEGEFLFITVFMGITLLILALFTLMMQCTVPLILLATVARNVR